MAAALPFLLRKQCGADEPEPAVNAGSGPGAANPSAVYERRPQSDGAALPGLAGSKGSSGKMELSEPPRFRTSVPTGGSL